jgi:catalase
VTAARLRIRKRSFNGTFHRSKLEKFADHYTQARLFFDRQTAVEKAHIAGGLHFELSNLTVPAIRERMVSSRVNVSAELAVTVGVPIDPAPHPTGQCP